MKRKVKSCILLATLFTVAIVNVKIVLDTNHSYDLSMASIRTLSNDEGGDGNAGDNNPENSNPEDNNPESNNEGSGRFFYKHLLGQPKKCTLYRNEHVNGTVTISENSLGGVAGWESTRITGLVEICPNKGGGCTAYSCQQTN
ncbi:hypothetical protein VCM39_00615 [Bacteroides sp. CG01]|uniref:hypothetical protein n=1 Tax=Bacteroides sp. CG01 TaxID=3096000 RepID=UPI002AFE0FF0|nr:hypothetical protein [Bacteroides sp. CG01]